MLGRSSYDRDYVDVVRARMRSRVDAFDAVHGALVAGAEEAEGGPDDSEDVARVLLAAEIAWFTDLVVVLDAAFVHRVRSKEGEDGDPLVEVRLLAESSLQHDGVLVVRSPQRLPADSSVLGLSPGDPVAVTREAFVRLCDAFLDALEARYLED